MKFHDEMKMTYLEVITYNKNLYEGSYLKEINFRGN